MLYFLLGVVIGFLTIDKGWRQMPRQNVVAAFWGKNCWHLQWYCVAAYQFVTVMIRGWEGFRCTFITIFLFIFVIILL